MSNLNLLEQLKADFSQIRFIKGRSHLWSPTSNEIYYSLPLSKYSLLHELGHALKKHAFYKLDIQLLKMEAEAWEKARQLAKRYGLTISQAYVNRCMNTYRDWLLARSRCPDCHLVGIQSSKNLKYTCCNCRQSWSVSSEIKCSVRRIRQKPPQASAPAGAF